MTETQTTQATGTITLSYRKEHPGGGDYGRCSYGRAGYKGIVVIDNNLWAPTDGKARGQAPAELTLTLKNTEGAAGVLAYTGPLKGGTTGRSGYRVAGVTGVVVFDNHTIGIDTIHHAPFFIGCNVAFRSATVKPAADTTAAVVAATVQAVADGGTIASPATVAATVAREAAKVAQAAKGKGKGHKVA